MVKLNLLAFLTLCVSSTTAFVSRPAFQTAANRKSKPGLSMYLDGATTDALTTLATPLLTSTIAIPSGTLLGTASSVFLDPSVEAEVLNDLAHVGLDLSTLLGTATPFIRLAVVIGRLCAIASDYLPDRYMHPEEIVFQSTMLLIASGGFFQSFLPLILASTAKMTPRDERAYQTMFQNVGVTWTQYKAMSAVAFDWVQVEPYQEVDDEPEFMYWLHGGDAQVQCAGKNIQNVTAGSAYHGLIGEMRFAQVLEQKNTEGESRSKPTTIRAGGSGATLLRINTKKLSMLMDHDKGLAESIRSLLVKGMREKLSALMD